MSRVEGTSECLFACGKRSERGGVPFVGAALGVSVGTPVGDVGCFVGTGASVGAALGACVQRGKAVHDSPPHNG